MVLRIATTVMLVLVLAFSMATAQNSGRVEGLLKEIDSWVLTDTSKIMAYIDSTKAVTTKMLESSKYWEPTVNDLTFLLGIDLITKPQIDNTGRIYFEMRLTGESSALFYLDKAMGWPIQLTPNNWTEEGFTISEFAVHPSGDFVIVSVYKHGDEMHDLWYFSRDGKFRPLLVDRKTAFFGPMYDEDNPDRFFVVTYDRRTIHFARYTLSTGVLDTLYTEPGVFFPGDYYKGKMTVIRSYSASEAQLCIYDLATNKMTVMSDTAIFSNALFTQDGKIVTLTSIKSKPEEFLKYCLLDPAKPNEFTILNDPRMEVDKTGFDRKKGLVFLILNKEGYSQLAAFDLRGASIPMPNTDIGIISNIGSNDSGEVVFDFSAPTMPPTVFKFKLGENKLQQIGKISTFGYDFSKIEVNLIKYKSYDGTMIPAFVYIPETAQKDGTNPAIIDYHGGPAGQSRPYFSRNMAFALSKGFIYMLPNVRGSSGYGPAYEQADNLEGRFNALKDDEAAIDYLINEGWSKPDKIAIWGGSYGGYTVDWLATQCPDKIACVVSQVGVSDPDHTILNSNPVFIPSWEKEYGPVGGALNRKVAPIFYAENVSKPILVTGGFNDPRVPPSDPRRFAYVLSRLGKPVWYYEATEAGHGAAMKAQLTHDLASSYVFTLMHVMK
ncbi:MAG: prolyl oligopeptidase family serine peptidase [candidate division Zixibacteria bacterium]|nr:prolyl oligopeptidase family serine peptidase [candidate division Zixibacteria bacterium]